MLITSFAPTLLRMELDRVPLWRGKDHVAVKQVVEDFASYLYLPRLKNPSVLIHTINSGTALMTWVKDSFAYAESFDDVEQRYRGLRVMQLAGLTSDSPQGLLVKPDVAEKQIEKERAKPKEDQVPNIGDGSSEGGKPSTDSGTSSVGGGTTTKPAMPKRFYGTVSLDSTRVGRDAGRIAEEVISHLSSLVGAKVTVTLDISVDIPAGVPDHVVRIVTENGRTLRFSSQGFEME